MKSVPRSSPTARYAILVANQQSHLTISAARLRRIVRAALAAEEVAAATMSVAVVDNATIHRLNRAHLNHDYATDVLSFLFESALCAGQGRRIDGEVVVSAQMALQTAGRIGWNAADELALYLVHGVLHLCGYDDHAKPDRRAMRRREKAILSGLGIIPAKSPRRKGGVA